MHCSISIAACIPRARTQTLGQAFSIALQHFHCSLHPARPNTNHSSALKKRTGFALQEIACIATAQPGPRRCNLRLGCIADIPAALQRRNAPETWLTPCVALADLTEALVQCKVIFCNIHTSWLQGLVSVARGPAALGWPQAARACLGRDMYSFPRPVRRAKDALKRISKIQMLIDERRQRQHSPTFDERLTYGDTDQNLRHM